MFGREEEKDSNARVCWWTHDKRHEIMLGKGAPKLDYPEYILLLKEKKR